MAATVAAPSSTAALMPAVISIPWCIIRESCGSTLRPRPHVYALDRMYPAPTPMWPCNDHDLASAVTSHHAVSGRVEIKMVNQFNIQRSFTRLRTACGHPAKGLEAAPSEMKNITFLRSDLPLPKTAPAIAATTANPRSLDIVILSSVFCAARVLKRINLGHMVHDL